MLWNLINPDNLSVLEKEFKLWPWPLFTTDINMCSCDWTSVTPAIIGSSVHIFQFFYPPVSSTRVAAFRAVPPDVTKNQLKFWHKYTKTYRFHKRLSIP